MPDNASVSHWLDGLKAGDDDDIQRLWDRYFRKTRPARPRRGSPHAPGASTTRRTSPSSAFHSFCERAGRGQFPQLADRDDLWRLLSVITARKVVATVRHGSRQKRGGGQAPGSTRPGDDGAAEPAMENVLSREPTPEDAAAFAESYERLFARLVNPTLRAVALRKLEGYSTDEIGAELGISGRTVQRKLELVRACRDEETGG